MKRIGLLSDTHGFLDPLVFQYFKDCDEIWHAGDFGTRSVAEALSQFKPLRGVYGNIDDEELREMYPLDNRFRCEGLDVWITHIGGRPGAYDRRIRKRLLESPPGLLVCGHSHVMLAGRWQEMFHLNPGAAGHQGFHQVRTMLRFEVHRDQIQKLQGIELGKRGRKK